jgi:peptidoglycan/xylan/chitin deacetylase (PgdA/CDA1 family)
MNNDKYKNILIISCIVSFLILVTLLGVIVWNDMNKSFSYAAKQEEVIKVIEPVITREDNEYFEGKKLVAITFDDGPSSSTTNDLVDWLSTKDARVSFFMVGNRVNKNAELVKKIYDAGHTIGNHSYSHKSFNKQQPDSYLYEINTTNQLIKDITGEDVIFLRPPYGSYKKSTLENVNMNFVLWSIDTLDWKTRNVDMIFEEIVNNVQDGDIVLMHDLYDTTVEAAKKSIDYLLENGYAVVSLEEMYRLRGTEPEMHASIRHMRLPEPEVVPEETPVEENQDIEKETSN